MSNTPLLALPYVAAGQTQKHVTHNEALRVLDAIVQLAVKGVGVATPLASPNDGDRYLVRARANGAFVGKDHNLAAFQDGAWALMRLLRPSPA